MARFGGINNELVIQQRDEATGEGGFKRGCVLEGKKGRSVRLRFCGTDATLDWCVCPLSSEFYDKLCISVGIRTALFARGVQRKANETVPPNSPRVCLTKICLHPSPSLMPSILLKHARALQWSIAPYNSTSFLFTAVFLKLPPFITGTLPAAP